MSEQEPGWVTNLESQDLPWEQTKSGLEIESTSVIEGKRLHANIDINASFYVKAESCLLLPAGVEGLHRYMSYSPSFRDETIFITEVLEDTEIERRKISYKNDRYGEGFEFREQRGDLVIGSNYHANGELAAAFVIRGDRSDTENFEEFPYRDLVDTFGELYLSNHDNLLRGNLSSVNENIQLMKSTVARFKPQSPSAELDQDTNLIRQTLQKDLSSQFGERLTTNERDTLIDFVDLNMHYQLAGNRIDLKDPQKAIHMTLVQILDTYYFTQEQEGRYYMEFQPVEDIETNFHLQIFQKKDEWALRRNELGRKDIVLEIPFRDGRYFYTLHREANSLQILIKDVFKKQEAPVSITVTSQIDTGFWYNQINSEEWEKSIDLLPISLNSA